MTCQEIAPKLSAFQDGELLDTERALVRRHLDTCESCAAEYQGLALAWERLGQLPLAGPRAHLWPGIERRLDTEPGLGEWRWLGWSPFPALATVALIVGLLLGLRVGGLVVKTSASPPHTERENDVDPIHAQYFGDVFPGSLPAVVLNVGVDTRTSQPGGTRR